MMRKHVLAMAVIIMLGAVVAMAVQQVVILKDGRRLTGEVTKTAKGYEIRMRGGTVVIATDQVVEVKDVMTLKDELAERLSKVDPRDAEGYYRVARWAVEKRLLVEARKILHKTLKLKPNHEDASLQLRLVEIYLASASATRPTATTPAHPVRPMILDPSKFLTKEDVYRIRLMELKPNDRVVIQFRNKVLERFIDSMLGKGDFREADFKRTFRGWSRVKQTRYIIEHTDRENASIRDDILVKSDPAVIREFKTRIWPIIARSFASPNCYGGVKGRDGMKLFNVPFTDVRIMYTNFYILHKWERGGQKFINIDNRERSLLLQYGLPRHLARLPAPKYITPIFRDREDRNYKLIDAWIGSLRWPFLAPGYRIDYKLPGQESAKPPPPTPTTKPAEK